MPGSLKVATFTVHATAEQSARWKRAAEAEGHASAGTWLAGAADAYLKVRARAGQPLPLAWHRGRFAFEGREVRGLVSHPFAIYRMHPRLNRYALLLLPTGRQLATLSYSRQCQTLASELARVWVRWDGQGLEPPSQDPGPILDRHRRESL